MTYISKINIENGLLKINTSDVTNVTDVTDVTNVTDVTDINSNSSSLCTKDTIPTKPCLYKIESGDTLDKISTNICKVEYNSKNICYYNLNKLITDDYVLINCNKDDSISEDNVCSLRKKCSDYKSVYNGWCISDNDCSSGKCNPFKNEGTYKVIKNDTVFKISKKLCYTSTKIDEVLCDNNSVLKDNINIGSNITYNCTPKDDEWCTNPSSNLIYRGQILVENNNLDSTLNNTEPNFSILNTVNKLCKGIHTYDSNSIKSAVCLKTWQNPDKVLADQLLSYNCKGYNTDKESWCKSGDSNWMLDTIEYIKAQNKEKSTQIPIYYGQCGSKSQNALDNTDSECHLCYDNSMCSNKEYPLCWYKVIGNNNNTIQVPKCEPDELKKGICVSTYKSMTPEDIKTYEATIVYCNELNSADCATKNDCKWVTGDSELNTDDGKICLSRKYKGEWNNGHLLKPNPTVCLNCSTQSQCPYNYSCMNGNYGGHKLMPCNTQGMCHNINHSEKYMVSKKNYLTSSACNRNNQNMNTPHIWENFSCEYQSSLQKLMPKQINSENALKAIRNEAQKNGYNNYNSIKAGCFCVYNNTGIGSNIVSYDKSGGPIRCFTNSNKNSNTKIHNHNTTTSIIHSALT